ncbi:MAG: hypothetical protein LBB23_03585 [Rickettsiales bacterium]|jgi:hypothetical protein|nr:hypothetical protein [Rickettsiales bacterium]
MFLLTPGDFIALFYNAAALASIAAVSLFPVWLGRRNGLDKLDMAYIMVGALLLGWTFFGWLYALCLSSKKK